MKLLPDFSKPSCAESSMNVGLRLLPQITTSSNRSNNVLLKSAVIRTRNQTSRPILGDFCYLKTCNLCNKKLSPDRDIYMYRGDQGFCSIECRNRQITMDDMKELERSMKKKKTMSSNYGHCWNESRRLETRLILKDLQMQRLKSKTIPCHNQNHWAIVS